MNVSMCGEFTLSKEQLQIFQFAIRNNYWYEMFIDDLPVWGYVGYTGTDHTPSAQFYLYQHRELVIGYNGDRIVEVDLHSGNPILLSDPSRSSSRTASTTYPTVHFTYSVIWEPRTREYGTRFDRYLDTHFFQHRVHWFSIINSFLLVLLLASIVSAILLRVLRKDLARYEKDGAMLLDDLEPDFGADEYGWKLVHGDVFRAPVHRIYLASFVGIGRQLLATLFLVIFATIFWDLYEDPGSIITASILIYIVCSVISGYVSASIYKRHGGKNWVKNVLLTATLLPAACSIVGIPINAIAMYFSSTRAVPLTTMIVLVLFWFFGCLPLTVIGSILGRHYVGGGRNGGPPPPPCRVHPVPRQIPEKPWYLQPLYLTLFAGILPFASIFIETYMVLTAFWSYRIYYVYGFALLVASILVAVTACITVVVTYLLLNAEDYQWGWKSFYVAGAPAAYVYLYSIYFFYHRTKMSGVFQTAFYFGYTTLMCLALFLLLGSVGYYVANAFVRRIYRNIKID